MVYCEHSCIKKAVPSWHQGWRRSFLPLMVNFSLSIWKCKSLNVEKWGWVIFPIRHSWLSSCGKNKISPLTASPLMWKFFFTMPAKPFMTQGENSFSTFMASPLKVEKSHPHFSTIRDLHFHIERENFTTKGGKDLFYPR